MSTEPPRGGTAPDEGFVAMLAAQLDQYAVRPRAGVAELAQDADEAADQGTQEAADQATAETPELADRLFLAVREQLQAEATWSGPPPGLRDGILSAARARVAEAVTVDVEAAAPVPPAIATPPAASAPENPSWPAQAWWRPSQWRMPRLVWAVPAAVAAAAVFTVGVLAVDRALAPEKAQGEEFVATGTALAPQATAEGEFVAEPGGFSITLEPEKLPAAAPGSYYAAWLTGPGGKVPIGSFHWRRTGAPIALWSGVDPDAYPTLSVTLQAEGDPPSPSTLVVLTADLTE